MPTCLHRLRVELGVGVEQQIALQEEAVVVVHLGLEVEVVVLEEERIVEMADLVVVGEVPVELSGLMEAEEEVGVPRALIFLLAEVVVVEVRMVRMKSVLGGSKEVEGRVYVDL